MQAVIMAGGFGSRLKPLTDNLPKPMMPIINKPILEYTVEHLTSHGIDDIIMTLAYRPESIVEYFGDGSDFGVRIRYCVETAPLGTAGGVKNAESLIEGDFLVISGDAFTNIDICDMRRGHESSGALLSMALKRVDDATGFGLVETRADGTIKRFVEKPSRPVAGKVNTGIYMAKREVLDFIPTGEKYDFARDLFPRILSRLGAYDTACYWSDIGTLSSYYLTNNDVALNPSSFNFVF